MSAPTYSELRAAGESAALECVNAARSAADEALVVRRWMMLTATHGYDSPAALSFICELAKHAVYEE